MDLGFREWEKQVVNSKPFAIFMTFSLGSPFSPNQVYAGASLAALDLEESRLASEVEPLVPENAVQAAPEHAHHRSGVLFGNH